MDMPEMELVLAGFFYVNLTQAKVTGEEGASVEKMPPKIWLQVSL